VRSSRLPRGSKRGVPHQLGCLGQPAWGSGHPPPTYSTQHRPIGGSGAARSPQTPTAPTVPHFHPAPCLSGSSLARRLVCHLRHGHCRQPRGNGAVRLCGLATPVSCETPPASERAASDLSNAKLRSSAFAPPHLTVDLYSKSNYTHLRDRNIKDMKLRTQTPDFPELLLVVPLASACPPPASP